MRRLIPAGLLIMVLLLSPVADGGIFDWHFSERAWLLLSGSSVDLGELKTDINGRKELFEKENALFIIFRCRELRDWQVLVTGNDFQSDTDSIPLNRLEWKTTGNYRSMPRRGNYLVLAESSDYPGSETDTHSLCLSYRLALNGAEYAGNYSSRIEVTLFFP